MQRIVTGSKQSYSSELLLRIIAACLSLLLTGCEPSWPPFSEQFSKKFHSNEESFEALAEKIGDSEPFRVSQTGILGLERVKDSFDVIADYHTDNGIRSETIDDDNEWEEHFRNAQAYSVSRDDDGGVYIGFVGELPLKNRIVFVHYAKSQTSQTQLKPCLDAHKELRCGVCSVSLNDEWLISYRWSPRDLLPIGPSIVVDDQISNEAYLDAYDALLKQCRKESYKAIGYDIDR